MTWAEYYENFYDWADSTQISRLSALSDFGPPEEVCEIAQDLPDDKAAQRLIKKALAAGLRFQPEEIMELSIQMDKPTLTKLVETSAEPFDRDCLEELYMLVDDDVFAKASRRAGVDIFADEEEPEDEFYMEEDEPEEVQLPKVGFFTDLALGIGLADRHKPHGHRSKCDGDCANCPDHYGYRYGRWYYGRHHTRGCEFGGNGGR